MQEFAQKRDLKFKVMPIEAKARALPTEFNSRNARVRCMLVFLFGRRPLDAESMCPIKAEEIKGGNLGLNYVFTGVKRGVLSNPANRILLHRKPDVSIREQILNINDVDKKVFLESHCINDDAYRALQDDDAERFVQERWLYIQKEEAVFYERFGINSDLSLVANTAQTDSEG